MQLSPKKTWEGFIGGGVSTVFISVALSYFFCQSDFMICPVGEEEEENRGQRPDRLVASRALYHEFIMVKIFCQMFTLGHAGSAGGLAAQMAGGTCERYQNKICGATNQTPHLEMFSLGRFQLIIP